MSDDLAFEDLKPIGTRRQVVHENYGMEDPRNGFYERDIDTFGDAFLAQGVEIREARRAVGLTLVEASEAAGLSVVQLSSLERGRATCDLAVLFARWLR